MNTRTPDIRISNNLLRRAQRVIPSATQTLAKGPQQHVQGIAPVFASHGKGGVLVDVDGNEFIDCTMGVGPLVLGYAHPAVDEAIVKQLQRGITFSLMHELEVFVAEAIQAIVPNAQKVRFSKTGADVTSAAVRLARAHTGKSTILCCGYHGWHDWYIGVTNRNAGIPESTQQNTYTFQYNDIDSVLDAIDHDTAAIILEPMVVEWPTNNFLQSLREICTEKNIVLIFDEMWTGFRMALGGAQEYFGVQADLTCFSKAIANGMPLSVLVGNEEIMQRLDTDVFFYTTFGGEALSLAAALATIHTLDVLDVPEHLAAMGTTLQQGVQHAITTSNAENIACVGYPARTMLQIQGADTLLVKSFIQQEFIKRGILWGGFHNLCYAHTQEHIHTIVEAYNSVLPTLVEARNNQTLGLLLEGTPMQPVFRKTTNFNTKPKQVV
jgi:glutamate-1-semialdehyde 2,1-aminomutase